MTNKEPVLWTPSPARIDSSVLQRFRNYLGDTRGLVFEDYEALHEWSVLESSAFWESLWAFCDVRSSTSPATTLLDADKFPGARWFEGARLNYAENLLRRRDDGVAIISRLENGERRELGWDQLYQEVARVAGGLRAAGVTKGDRVVGMMPNVAETVIAMLATASIGALWSSCSPDFGVSGVLDRFGQIGPKVLFACDGYFYNGKTVDCRDKLGEVSAALDTLSQTVVIGTAGLDLAAGNVVTWEDFSQAEGVAQPLAFEQLPFNHPLFIMYSSGTTGVPKCIVHSAGGTLLQHLKEHQLHVGVQPGDAFFYFTTCGWMMWNWLVSGLASGATLVLYDGSPFYPGAEALFDMADAESIDIFGVGAKYLSAIEKAGLKPRVSHDLASLRSMLSTGSPLSQESFRYVYRDIKADVCLSSISGGTDIISCFVLGNECLPVVEGELQCLGLGMAVEIWDENGTPVREAKGELVCTKPFPSAPVGFWDDVSGERYHKAYFASYDGIWAHGDYAEITANGGMIIHGRSDAVLNPGGVRIGTAEIYRQVEKLPEVSESVCVGQQWEDDVRVVLFVVLQEGYSLDEGLIGRIRTSIREGTTPRHVPAKVIAVADIPRTRSGKIAELAVRSVIDGKSVSSTEALSNPESLELYSDLEALKD